MNRERGHTAGLRTTLLVCLAAAIAMVQVNLLLSTAGKTPDNFNTLDLMRLPLGILSGMGFIGTGAVLRNGGQIHGITTAATLWFATVMGLCFGGGQVGLGATAFGMAGVILWGLKAVEHRLAEPRRGRLVLVTVGNTLLTDAAVRLALTSAGYTAACEGVAVDRRADHVGRHVEGTAGRRGGPARGVERFRHPCRDGAGDVEGVGRRRE
jgi:putative Mg2+ transporter-C (MgtC) family protein